MSKLAITIVKKQIEISKRDSELVQLRNDLEKIGADTGPIDRTITLLRKLNLGYNSELQQMRVLVFDTEVELSDWLEYRKSKNDERFIDYEHVVKECIA